MPTSPTSLPELAPLSSNLSPYSVEQLVHLDLSPKSPQEVVSFHWSPLAISSFGAVCAFFLLICYCKVIKRPCCSFLFRNRVQRPQLQIEARTGDPNHQLDSRMLESSVLHSLPITQFKKKDEGMRHSEECAVCLGEYEDGVWLKQLPNCSHEFHVACIDTWFQIHSNCPLCRSHVREYE